MWKKQNGGLSLIFLLLFDTVRLWSLGQQRCITTYRIHGEGVWALCANENFTGFYSSRRDKNVMWTDLNMDDSSTLLFVEDAPVLKVSQLIKLVAVLVQKSRIFLPND